VPAVPPPLEPPFALPLEPLLPMPPAALLFEPAVALLLDPPVPPPFEPAVAPLLDPPVPPPFAPAVALPFEPPAPLLLEPPLPLLLEPPVSPPDPPGAVPLMPALSSRLALTVLSVPAPPAWLLALPWVPTGTIALESKRQPETASRNSPATSHRSARILPLLTTLRSA
jgi:hypothetical protein